MEGFYAKLYCGGYIVKALYNREYVYGTYWIYCAFAYLGSRFLTALTIVSSIECAKNCGFEECLCVSHVDCLEQFYGVFESLDEAEDADMRSSIEGARKQYNFLVACVMPPRAAQIVNHFGYLKLREREDGTYCFDLGDGRVFPIWNTKDGAYPLYPPSEREEYRKYGNRR